MRAYRLTLLVILYDTPSVITFITYSNMNSMKSVLYPVQEPYTTFRVRHNSCSPVGRSAPGTEVIKL